MTDFVRLPAAVLVTPPEVEALRKKFADAQRLTECQAFWKRVQDSRQPKRPAHVSSWPFDGNGSPMDFEDRLPIG